MFELFVRTEVGCVRERNEDAFFVYDLAARRAGLGPETLSHRLAPPGTIVAVCDGMGGAASGDLASTMTVETLATHAGAARIASLADAEGLLLHAVGAANTAIFGHAAAHPEHRGMGTTITAMAALGPRLVLVQAGDTRAYLRRGELLQQITVDHSIVHQDPRTGTARNVLLQALGVKPAVEADVIEVDLRDGDVVLLCSDGLSDVISDPQILAILLHDQDPMRCCRALTEAACGLGGPDNVTVAVGRFLGSGLPEGGAQFPIVPRRRTVTLP